MKPELIRFRRADLPRDGAPGGRGGRGVRAKHLLAERTQLAPIGLQTGDDARLVRNELVAKPENVVRASLLLLGCSPVGSVLRRSGKRCQKNAETQQNGGSSGIRATKWCDMLPACDHERLPFCVKEGQPDGRSLRARKLRLPWGKRKSGTRLGDEFLGGRGADAAPTAP
jgi:hypothetical protein